MDAESESWADAKLRKESGELSPSTNCFASKLTRKIMWTRSKFEIDNNKPRSRWAWPSVSLSERTVQKFSIPNTEHKEVASNREATGAQIGRFNDLESPDEGRDDVSDIFSP